MRTTFGIWFKRLREMIGLSLVDCADVLGLDARETVGAWQKLEEPTMHGTNLEALLRLLGYSTVERMREDWLAERFPNVDDIQKRISVRYPEIRLKGIPSLVSLVKKGIIPRSQLTEAHAAAADLMNDLTPDQRLMAFTRAWLMLRDSDRERIIAEVAVRPAQQQQAPKK